MGCAPLRPIFATFSISRPNTQCNPVCNTCIPPGRHDCLQGQRLCRMTTCHCSKQPLTESSPRPVLNIYNRILPPIQTSNPGLVACCPRPPKHCDASRPLVFPSPSQAGARAGAPQKCVVPVDARAHPRAEAGSLEPAKTVAGPPARSHHSAHPQLHP
jgi:hypothetical protein